MNRTSSLFFEIPKILVRAKNSQNLFFKMSSSSLVSNGLAPGKSQGLSPGQLAKRAAAYKAVDEFVVSNQVLGIGTGSTAEFLVERLAEKVEKKELSGLVCIPSSFSARNLLIQHGLQLSDLQQQTHIDLCIDGADEIDPQLNCIKGGGGCHFMEKAVQCASDRFILIADESKKSGGLGEKWKAVPVEVHSSLYALVAQKIEKIEGGKCNLRTGTGKAGPVVTDNGNLILDWDFPKEGNRSTEAWKEIHTRIKLIPGVLETGLFLGVAEKAIIGSPDGSAQIIDAPSTD